eukprot:547884-Rhodomonas_salina.1
MAPPVSVPCPAVLDMGRKVLVGMVIVEPTDQQYTSSFARNDLETALFWLGQSRGFPSRTPQCSKRA